MQQLAQYGNRVSRILNHPVRQLIVDYVPIQEILNNKYTLPAIGRLYDELKDLKIHMKQLPPVPMHLQYKTKPPSVFSTLAQTPKRDKTSSQWKEAFTSLINSKYSNHKMFFTDGSFTRDHCGCGVYSEELSIMARLPSYSSIFTAELYAIYSCIKFIADLKDPSVIFSDSLSAITALQSLHSQPHFLLNWIQLELLRHPHIKLEWVPSHMNIEGNEKSDMLARDSSKLTYITSIPISESEMRRHIQLHYRSQWEVAWSNQSNYINGFKTCLGPTAFEDAPRPIQVSLTRLRLGVLPLTHIHHYSDTPRIFCKTCKVPFSINHLLISCPKFFHMRLPLKIACSNYSIPFCSSSLLSGQMPSEIIESYLRATEMMDLL